MSQTQQPARQKTQVDQELERLQKVMQQYDIRRQGEQDQEVKLGELLKDLKAQITQSSPESRYLASKMLAPLEEVSRIAEGIALQDRQMDKLRRQELQGRIDAWAERVKSLDDEFDAEMSRIEYERRRDEAKMKASRTETDLLNAEATRRQKELFELRKKQEKSEAEEPEHEHTISGVNHK